MDTGSAQLWVADKSCQLFAMGKGNSTRRGQKLIEGMGVVSRLNMAEDLHGDFLAETISRQYFCRKM